MASKTLYLNSTGVTPTNIHADTKAYTTPDIAKNGGTYRITIAIHMPTALGISLFKIDSIKLHYTVYGTRTSSLGSKGTVDTGYVGIAGDIYETHHGTQIGRGENNKTPFSDDITPYVLIDTQTILMRFTNPIAAQTNSFVISNVSIVVNYTPRYNITVQASPEAYGTAESSAYNLIDHGAKVTLTATPNSGYRFVKWNDENTSAVRTVTITANTNFIAYFEVAKTNKIYIGTSRPTAIYIGTQEVKAVYIGTTKVYG